jgi:hypothetical protein
MQQRQLLEPLLVIHLANSLAEYKVYYHACGQCFKNMHDIIYGLAM